MKTIVKEKKNISEMRNIILSGQCITKLKENMLSDGDKWNKEKIDKIILTSYKAISKLPPVESKTNCVNRILCLGKVQSGKTAFFITTMALAMDNNYNLIYVIGGTKSNLLGQNTDRIKGEFKNNDYVFVTDINNTSVEEVRRQISAGIKVVLMVLKGKSVNSNRNIKNLEVFTESLHDIPSLIVDDEGDQVSLGKKESKKNNYKVPVIHSGIVNVLRNIDKGSYLSVTATPQANLLIPTLNEISPNYCVLIEPGIGYTGANTFHDCENNDLVEGIDDCEEFENSVPDSFVRAFYFYIVGCAIQRINGNNGKISMLIHPSALKSVHINIYNKVRNKMKEMFDSIPESSGGHDNFIENVEIAIRSFCSRLKKVPNISQIVVEISNMRAFTEVLMINTDKVNKTSNNKDKEDFYRYKIYVGGNMLERGITLDNLTVTYIYRVAKKDNAVDTLFQRARWFGYKENYIQYCKVYMHSDMKQMFISMNEHENHLWRTLSEFLKRDENIMNFPRFFRLEVNGNLILTRKSISKTINAGGLHPGYAYDKTVLYDKKEDIRNNYNLLTGYFKKFEPNIKKFGNQYHAIYENISFKSLYNDVFKKYNFPKDASNVNSISMSTLFEAVKNHKIYENIKIVVMRYNKYEKRSLVSNGRYAISELPQGYDIKSHYPGDKEILPDELTIQIHYVYTDNKSKKNLIPFIVINNPNDLIKINMVTGEHKYGNN